MRTVLFVCTGNTCRSPLAEAIAREWSRQQGLREQLFFASAGTHASSGSPIAEETVVALQNFGIEHSGTSKPLTAEMIRKADHVICMTPGHAEEARHLVENDPDASAKIVLLNPDEPIDDPIGMGQKAYDALAKKFRTLIPQRMKELLSHEDRSRVGSSG
ncbi:MAG: hypothetical protein EA377_04455 [Phycisphaerales bacterium]|nr:MAG: hypothetical protein EA377_04455 [Phycisphaerales bacterium]